MRWPVIGVPYRNRAVGSFAFMGKYFLQSGGLISSASAVWPAANRAIYLPFELDAPMIATKTWVFNGSAVAGTVDMGIYSEDGVRLVSKGGADSQAGTSAAQNLDITDTLIGRGRFYLGISFSSGSAQTFRFAGAGANDWLLWGALQEASAHPLPATMTPASNVTLYLPLCGFTGRLT